MLFAEKMHFNPIFGTKVYKFLQKTVFASQRTDIEPLGRNA